MLARPVTMITRTTVLSLCVLTGCSAQLSDSAPRPLGDDGGELEADIAEALEQLGFDPAEAVLLPQYDGVRVHGDMVFSIDDLLQAKDLLVEKGYKTIFNTPVSPAHSRGIKLAWAVEDQAPHAVVRSIFAAAGEAWSSARSGNLTASDLSISPNNSAGSAATITIHQVHPDNWDNTPCASWAQACAWPVPVLPNSRPANHIYFQSQKGPCAWSLETLRAMALHELGHAIGFWHPGELINNQEPFHVDGTGECLNDPIARAWCPLLPPYPTVMNAILFSDSNCNPTTPTSLTADDKLTAATVY